MRETAVLQIAVANLLQFLWTHTANDFFDDAWIADLFLKLCLCRNVNTVRFGNFNQVFLALC